MTGNGNEPIGVTRPTDGGRTFGSTEAVDAAGNNRTGNGRQGSAIDTGPDGTVYVAFEQGGAQVVAVSRDGGVTYGRPITIGPSAISPTRSRARTSEPIRSRSSPWIRAT